MSIYQAEAYDPETGECTPTLIVLHKGSPKLSTREKELVDYIRANPMVELVKLQSVFSLDSQEVDNLITSIEHKGILFGELDGQIEIVKENGVYKE